MHVFQNQYLQFCPMTGTIYSVMWLLNYDDHPGQPFQSWVSKGDLEEL